MGIPSYFSHIIRKYSKIIDYTLQLMKAIRNGWKKMNLNQIKILKC